MSLHFIISTDCWNSFASTVTQLDFVFMFFLNHPHSFLSLDIQASIYPTQYES